MAIIAKDAGGGDFKPVPADVHEAVCIWMVNLGIQSGGMYAPKHQAYIKWEIPGERIRYEKDGKEHEGPMTIGNFYTVSLSEKAHLRSDLEGWRGKPFTEEELAGFDITKVVGTPCRLVVEHKRKDDNKVVAYVKSVIRSKDPHKPEGDLIVYDDDHPQNYDKLPEWLQKKVDNQIRVKEQPDASEAPLDDDLSDIPF